MNFKVMSNGQIIECNIVLTFENNNINYIVYTDGTRDEDGDLEIYASRYELENENYVLKPIENDYEWDLIDKKIEEKGI